ncbi:hypothetical protein DdX_07988 [Ditylenchus destructor]|uniref:Uncharacterized protein n=1 Tax=Ditylenchus destructor TaxID=166010 RepID=A0AAD4N3K0_9BILA|nr:hypothetical protein DdX_07988 [Ditylenchus destructor]
MYKVLTENLQQELREQDDRFKRHLQWEQERKLQLEDAIRTQFGDEQLNQLKAFIETNNEKKGSERKANTNLWKHDSSRPATAATLVGHQESSPSVPLSLTSSFSSMDSQPLSRNLLPRGGRMATPQEGHDRDVQSANFGKSRTNSNLEQTNRFTASAHSTRRNHRPSPTDYKDDLEDISHLLLDDGGEIEEIGPGDASALSRSHDSGISVRKSTMESPRIRSVHPVPTRRRSRGPAMGSRQLSNILSERAEPKNVISNVKRTISATLPAASSRGLVRESESTESSNVSMCERRDSAVHVDNIRLDGEVGSFRNPDRISSASVLPKPRPRIRSMPVSEPQLQDDPDLPPNYSGETDEEDVVDDILNNSLPHRSAATKAASRAGRPSSSNKSTRGSISAKSHDSGYLEGPFSRK